MRITQKRPDVASFQRAAWQRGLFGALLVAWAGLWPVTAAAGVQRIVVPVRGMTCPLCTRGVEASVKNLEEVGTVTADLASGRVTVEAAAGKSLVLQQVRDRILRAGFRVGGEYEVLASARFVLAPAGRIMMRLPGTAYTYQLLEDGEFLHLMKTHPGLKGEYAVGFRVHDHPSWKPPGASILSFEVMPTPSAGVSGR